MIATREDRGYTTRQIAEILGISGGQVRALVRAGFLSPKRGPGGEFRFTFRDVVLLRTTKELGAAGVSPRRVKRALRKLQDELDRGGSLSEIRMEAAGGRVVVRDSAGVWEPESGQVELDFSVEGDAESRESEVDGVGVIAHGIAAGPEGTSPGTGPPHSAAAGIGGIGPFEAADDWYNLGIDLEADSPERALEAYDRALAIQPDHADARTNRGRLLHEVGDVRAAEACYRAALDADPDHALTAFNLGVALEDLGRPGEAADTYERSLVADPTLASAHFNLARLREREGREDTALGHLADYRRLTQERG